MIYLGIYLLLILSIFNTKISKKELLIKLNGLFIAFGLSTYILSELLSCFNIFNIYTIQVISIVILVGALGVYLKKREKRHEMNIIEVLFGKNQRLFLITFILLLLSAILYSPNNWDSNTYHLPRLVSWLQNGNLDNFATHIFRQAYQPVFAEIQLSWIYATGGSIVLLNILQLVYLFHLVLVIYLLLIELVPLGKVTIHKIILAILLVFSLVLQAVTTKNDVILTFYMFNYLLVWVILIKYNKLSVSLGIASAALAILTKGTAYIFLLGSTIPLVAFYLRRYSIKEIFTIKKIRTIALILVSVVVIVSPFIYRNLKLSGNIFGHDDFEKNLYQNEYITAGSVVSNTIKNASYHVAVPGISGIVYNVVIILHEKLGLPDVNDEKLNFIETSYDDTFKKRKPFASDNVPNYLLFAMTLLSAIFYFFNRKQPISKLWLLTLIVVGVNFVLFSALLKWQPWHTRVLIPVFLLLAISNILFIAENKYGKYINLLIVINGVICILFNVTQPIIQVSPVTYDYSYNNIGGNYYQGLPEKWNSEYNYQAINEFYGKGEKRVGIICGNNDLIFPFMYNNRIWKNKYYYLGEIDNPTASLQNVDIYNLDVIIGNKELDEWKVFTQGLKDSVFKEYIIPHSKYVVLTIQ